MSAFMILLVGFRAASRPPLFCNFLLPRPLPACVTGQLLEFYIYQLIIRSTAKTRFLKVFVHFFQSFGRSDGEDSNESDEDPEEEDANEIEEEDTEDEEEDDDDDDDDDDDGDIYETSMAGKLNEVVR